MKLEMKDKPGQLVAALKPISDIGGNIISVIHERDLTSAPTDTIDVQLMIDLPDGTLDSVVQQMKNLGVNIVRIGEERLLIRRSVIIIGHLMHTDLSDTVDRIDSTGFAEVAELAMVMPSIDGPSSAKITIKADHHEDIQRALESLRDVAAQKGLLIIEPLEDDA